MTPFLRARHSAPILRPIIQRLLAKWPSSAALAMSVALVAPSCVPDPYHADHHRPPSGGHRPPSGGGSATNAYNTGHSDGTRDRERGRRYDPQPGQNRFPSSLRDDYRRGYDAGYRRGGGGGSGWTQRRAYDDGNRHGRQDKISGLSRNPGRHMRDVPSAFHNEFRRGYTNGWNSAPTTGRPTGPHPRPPRPLPY